MEEQLKISLTVPLIGKMLTHFCMLKMTLLNFALFRANVLMTCNTIKIYLYCLKASFLKIYYCLKTCLVPMRILAKKPL